MRYINTKTYEVLEGVIPKGIDWLEIPKGATTAYYFDGNDPDGDEVVAFYDSESRIYFGESWSYNIEYVFYRAKWGKLVWGGDVKQLSTNVKSPIKSDGGSSSYYFTELPQHLIDDIVKRGGIEIKDIVRYCFDNDADCKDIIKALKRIRENFKGGGKEGCSSLYNANKVVFFAEELRHNLKMIGENNES